MVDGFTLVIDHPTNPPATYHFRTMEGAIEWFTLWSLKRTWEEWEDRSLTVYEPNPDRIRLYKEVSSGDQRVRIEPIYWMDGKRA